MKILKTFQIRIQGLTNAVTRFPITTIFLLVATITNAVHITSETDDYPNMLLTFIVGAFLATTLQVTYERYAHKLSYRILTIVASLLLAIGYYFITLPAQKLGVVILIRTFIGLFSLFLAFIWIPVIRSRHNFNENFMAVFKALFSALFFFGIIFAGISIILATTNQLLFDISGKSYLHSLNIIFTLFCPIYFLSLIPIFPGNLDTHKSEEELTRQEEIVSNAIHCPKFLEILVSYIIVPLISIFTLILIIYLLRNISGDFWTNNLLEPMIISYSITVIILYILVSELDNRFAHYFRKICPKVLVPIVIFQVIATFLNLDSTGITHKRYFVLIYGIFSIIAGILLCFLPVRKNGIIAAIIIVFSVISITPPVDAFTISRASQLAILEHTLNKNHMLEKNLLTPSASLSYEDKERIITTTRYLYDIEYTEHLNWLPKNFNYYDSFEKTFGFNSYDGSNNIQQPVYLSLKQQTPIDITGYDNFIYSNVYIAGAEMETKLCDFHKSGQNFSLIRITTKNQCTLKLVDSNNKELIRFNTMEIFDQFKDNNVIKEQLSADQATFSKDSDFAKMTLILQNLNIEYNSKNPVYSADLYILINIK